MEVNWPKPEIEETVRFAVGFVEGQGGTLEDSELVPFLERVREEIDKMLVEARAK